MRPRISRPRWVRLPRSLQARTTLAAGLAALVLFSVGAWAMDRVTYRQRMTQSRSEASGEVELIMNAVTPDSWPDGDGNWGQYPYELVGSGGLMASSSSVAAFERNGAPYMPEPAAYTGVDGIQFMGSTTARFPKLPGRTDNALSGQTLTALTGSIQVSAMHSSVLPVSLTSQISGKGAVVRLYVFVTTTQAQDAVAAINRVLYPGVPAATLLVAAVAFLATRRALRPVEEIRVRTAAVTASDPRERVAVPRTGDEIARLAVTINETLERLESASRTQRRFVADAAHELRKIGRAHV